MTNVKIPLQVLYSSSKFYYSIFFLIININCYKGENNFLLKRLSEINFLSNEYSGNLNSIQNLKSKIDFAVEIKPFKEEKDKKNQLSFNKNISEIHDLEIYKILEKMNFKKKKSIYNANEMSESENNKKLNSNEIFKLKNLYNNGNNKDFNNLKNLENSNTISSQEILKLSDINKREYTREKDNQLSFLEFDSNISSHSSSLTNTSELQNFNNKLNDINFLELNQNQKKSKKKIKKKKKSNNLYSNINANKISINKNNKHGDAFINYLYKLGKDSKLINVDLFKYYTESKFKQD